MSCVIRRGACVTLVLALMLWPRSLPAQSAPSGQGLDAGIQQVNEGDFEAAVQTLEALVGRLEGVAGQEKELVQAYVYLGIAHLGLNQEAVAKTKFLEALSRDRNLVLGREAFPPKVVRLFEQIREEAGMLKAPAPSASEKELAPPPKEKKKGGGSKLVLIGLGGAAAAGIGIAVGKSKPNTPPTASLSISPTGQALAGVTVMNFTGSGTDPDGDRLSYAWNFGDGASGQGQNTTHVYNTDGGFGITLTVSDGRGGSANANGNVTARSITGRWNYQNETTRYFTFTQAGGTFTGRYTTSSPVSGTLTNPRNIAFTLNFSGTIFRFEGTVDPTLQFINGAYVGGSAFTFVRQ